MPTKKIKNNTISLSEISDKVWCEIVCNESNCVLTLFPQNIPEDYRGKKNTDTVKCTVSCPTTTETHHLSRIPPKEILRPKTVVSNTSITSKA